jgi:hypothetical protein
MNLTKITNRKILIKQILTGTTNINKYVVENSINIWNSFNFVFFTCENNIFLVKLPMFL